MLIIYSLIHLPKPIFLTSPQFYLKCLVREIYIGKVVQKIAFDKTACQVS